MHVCSVRSDVFNLLFIYLFFYLEDVGVGDWVNQVGDYIISTKYKQNIEIYQFHALKKIKRFYYT